MTAWADSQLNARAAPLTQDPGPSLAGASVWSSDLRLTSVLKLTIYGW